MRQKTRQRGFTLIEMVIVIVIMGVIGSIVAVFMRSPIDAYFDSARRAALTDVADTTVRRMARDVRKALPNSLRLPLSGSPSACIEFIPTKTGGRYRADVDASGNGDILNFVAPDASFDMLGANSALADQAIAPNDVIAVYNLGIPGADAYNLDNTSAVTSVVVPGSLVNETKINIAVRQFPLASGSSRFHVIPATEHVVSYVCTDAGTSAGQGTGTLYRYARVLAAAYATPANCPAPPPGTPVLAKNVSSCSFVYNGSDLQRNAMVQVMIGLTHKSETVSLYHEVHVDNTP